MFPGHPQTVGRQDACIVVRVVGLEGTLGRTPKMSLYVYAGLEGGRDIFGDVVQKGRQNWGCRIVGYSHLDVLLVGIARFV